MQGMAVFAKSSAKPTEDQTGESAGSFMGTEKTIFYARICLGFYNDILTDFGTSYLSIPPSVATEYLPSGDLQFTDMSPLWNLTDTSLLSCAETNYSIKFRWKGRITITGVVGDIQQRTASIALMSSQVSHASDILWTGSPVNIPKADSASFDFDTGEVELTAEGIKEMYLSFLVSTTHTSIQKYVYDVAVNTSRDSHFSIEATSICADTSARVNMIHEVLSRIAESITNNAITIKSSWYGRPDSDVNAADTFGGGALKAITSGLKIRSAKLTDGTEPYLSLSFLDMLRGLSPIDNLGWGFVTEGENRYVRVEPWYWFYKDEVLLDINNAPSVIRTVNPKELYSRFSFGYKKYETSGINGLDSFMSERTYATRLKLVDSAFEQISEFVADSYAIEYTRRQTGSSSNWAYDNDVFVMCLKVDKATGSYSLDRGVTDHEGSILSPASLYNARISPVRNASRWLNRLFSFAKNSIEYAKFTSGTCNYKAKCKAAIYDSTIAACSDTGAVIEESGVMQSSSVLLKPEKIAIEGYTITKDEYAAIKANPYGAIMVDGEKCYLLELKYTRKTSKATFTLVPAHDSTRNEAIGESWKRSICGEILDDGDYAKEDYGTDYNQYV